MGHRQRRGDLAGDPRRFHRLERSRLAQAAGEVQPVDELHDDELRLAVGAVVVDRHDVGMVQRRRAACLGLEARREADVGAELGSQDLQRHLAVELLVHRAPDRGHAALAERSDDAVPAADQRAKHLFHVRFSSPSRRIPWPHPPVRWRARTSLRGPIRTRRGPPVLRAWVSLAGRARERRSESRPRRRTRGPSPGSP